MQYKNNLKEVIENGLEIPLKDAALKIGITKQNLNGILTGIRYPSMVTLAKIADALGLSVEVRITFKRKK